jgi:hypothetical protein
MNNSYTIFYSPYENLILAMKLLHSINGESFPNNIFTRNINALVGRFKNCVSWLAVLMKWDVHSSTYICNSEKSQRKSRRHLTISFYHAVVANILQKFYLVLIHNLLDTSAGEPYPQSPQKGRSNPQASHKSNIKNQSTDQWPTAATHFSCSLYSVEKK